MMHQWLRNRSHAFRLPILWGGLFREIEVELFEA